MTLVAEGVHVANDWECNFGIGLLQHVNWSNVCHLVNSWREWNVRACHLGNAWAPHTASNNDVFGFNATLVRNNSRDLTVLGFEVEYFGVCKHL